MMRSCTKRRLDEAVTCLKQDGYSALILMFDKNHDQVQYPCICGVFQHKDCPAHGNRPTAIEIMCSETNDPHLLALMAKDALAEMSQPAEHHIVTPEAVN